METVVNALGRLASWVLGSGLLSFAGVEVYKEIRRHIDGRNRRKRRARNIYVLRAMGTLPNANELAPDLRNVRFDTATIADRLYLVMAAEVCGDIPLAGVLANQAQEQRHKERFIEQAQRLQLPSAHLSREERYRQLRPILDEIAQDGMLTYLPPDNWMLRV